MRAVLRLRQRATYAEYVAFERGSERRHEFIDGVIVATAGGSHEHNAISGRVALALGARLRAPCRYYSPDQRFWIAATARGRYSDASIICGAPESPVHDDQATTNPTVIVEVLSPSSEGDDEGDKRLDFQSLASLEAYVLIAQDDRGVRVYRRTTDWTAETYRGGDSIELPRLVSAIPISELYQDVLDEHGRSLLRG